MKLVSFSTDNGDSYGIATEEGIIDAGAVLGEQFPDLRSVLAGGALGTLEAAAKGQTAALQLAEVRVLPVIPNPGKIMCIGINYESHRQEIGRRSLTILLFSFDFPIRWLAMINRFSSQGSRTASISKENSPSSSAVRGVRFPRRPP